MGWGEVHAPRDSSVGTTGQIETAHMALDRFEVAPGPLALRVLAFVGMLQKETT